MSFWNEDFYFEKRGDRYVYRPTVLSEGFDVSESEKDRLFAALKRLQWRSLLEGAIAITVLALAFMTGAIETKMPIQWFLISAILAVAVLGLTVAHRRDRQVSDILGGRRPDVPRLPFRQALSRPRPVIARRYAVPVLRSVVVLFGLAIALCDALVVYLVVTAYRSQEIAEGTKEMAAVEQFFALTVHSWEFWAVVFVINAVLIGCIAALIAQVRILRARLDSDE